MDAGRKLPEEPDAQTDARKALQGKPLLAGTPPYFAPRDGELASSQCLGRTGRHLYSTDATVMIRTKGDTSSSNRPFFGERLKGFEPQPDARNSQETSRFHPRSPSLELQSCGAPGTKSSLQESLQLLPDSELHASHRRLVSLCLLLAGRSCRAAVAHANLPVSAWLPSTTL